MQGIVDIYRSGCRRWMVFMLALLLSLVCVSALADVEINEDNFPDANFRNIVTGFDKNRDGALNDAEIENVKQIDCPKKSISDLTGIEHFTALTHLFCFSNQLSSLDVSQNTALSTLHCYSNQLTSLDVSGCTALSTLYCYNNQLSSLDVSQNTGLASLNCSSNQLSSLDVSRNTALSSLNCSSNQLSSLDVSRNMALSDLDCSLNQLTSLDVSQNSKLRYLDPKLCAKMKQCFYNNAFWSQ